MKISKQIATEAHEFIAQPSYVFVCVPSTLFCPQEVARTSPFTIWMDTSTRFANRDLRPFFLKAKRLGVVVSNTKGSIAMRTHTKTFQYLGEQPCTFRDRDEFQGGFVMLYSNPTTVQYFMKPWVSCALVKGCMYPDDHAREYLDCGKHGQVYFDCHRFDQSVLGILLSRTFGTNVADHGVDTKDYHSFCKGSDDSWYWPAFLSAAEPMYEVYKEECFWSWALIINLHDTHCHRDFKYFHRDLHCFSMNSKLLNGTIFCIFGFDAKVVVMSNGRLMLYPVFWRNFVFQWKDVVRLRVSFILW